MYTINNTHFDQLRKGCPTAFSDIHAQYSRSIFWLGKRYLQDDFVIESLVQDAFLKLWINRDKIESSKHIYFFLRLVMKQSCISYYNMPKNKFFRKVNSLEGFDNFQDYLAGYDPKDDAETLKAQETEQQYFDLIKKVLPLLQAESSRLISLCLKYDFDYKAISKGMGTSITTTSNKVKKAIDSIKTIIDQGGPLETPQSASIPMKGSDVLTEQQAAVVHLRCEANHSFAAIATALNLSQKEVHRAFMAAYTLLRDKHQVHQKSA